MIKIGLSRPISSPPHPIADIDAGLLAQRAEALGFDAIYYGEHPIRPLSDPGVGVHDHGVPLYQDTLVALTRAAALTQTLKVAGGVFLMPEHNPIAFAKQLATLDYYGGGRLIVGLGTGWSRLEIELLGGRFERRWAQMREAVLLMKALWTQDSVTFDGEFWSVPPVQCFPQPKAKPHPPIYLGGQHFNDNLFPRIADYADGWLAAFVTPEDLAAGPEAVRQRRAELNRLAEAKGRDPKSLHIDAIADGEITRDVVRRFEDASLERLAVTLPPLTSLEEGYSAMERIAERLL